MLKHRKYKYNDVCQIVSNDKSEAIEKFSELLSKYKNKKVLFVSDESLDTDLRVRALCKAAMNLGLDFDFIELYIENIASEKPSKEVVYYYHSLIKEPGCVYDFYRLCKAFDYQPRTLLPIKYFGIYNDKSYFKSTFDIQKYDVVYANNLNSLRFASNFNKTIIYDIHEWEVFRQRKSQSALRSMIAYMDENKLLKKVDECVTISNRFKEIYRKYYSLKQDIHVIHNQHFERYQSNTTKKYVDDVILLYIGHVSSNRGIDRLIEICKHDSRLNLMIIACSISQSDYENYREYIMHVGLNYTESLRKIVDDYTYVYSSMLFDQESLSYKLALPNKFFQSIMLNIPLLAFKSSYIGEIVEINKIGINLELDLAPSLMANKILKNTNNQTYKKSQMNIENYINQPTISV